LRHHIPGCRIISRPEADERADRYLGPDSFMSGWRRHDVSWRRIVDTELWCSTEKRIIMDADILVVDRPVGLLEWIQHGNRPFMMGQPPVASPAEAAAECQPARYVQAAVKVQGPALSGALLVSKRFVDGWTWRVHAVAG